MKRVRQAAIARLTRWSARRHGRDTLPHTVGRRRIYIIPSRFGVALGLLLVAMLIAGLNYNSNLGLAFGFLMTGLALVAMHHCNRNLLNLRVDMVVESDTIAGRPAEFRFVLYNDSAVPRYDIEIHCAAGEAGRRGATIESAAAEAMVSVAAMSYQRAEVEITVTRRGIAKLPRVELRTRYPFGWFRAWTYVHMPLTAYVAPHPAGTRLLPAAAAATGITAQSEQRGDEDFSGLRAYEAGVPLKHMAWKVLARGGEPAVRSYTGLGAEPEWLDFESLAKLDVEARLSQLCRWIDMSDAAHRAYGLRLPGTVITPARGPAHRLACLRALASFTTTPPMTTGFDS